MANPLDSKALVTLGERALSNMWEVAALAEGLEKKGLLPRWNELAEAVRGRNSSPQLTAGGEG